MLSIIFYKSSPRMFSRIQSSPDETFNPVTHPTSQNNWTAWPCSSLQGNNVVGRLTHQLRREN